MKLKNILLLSGAVFFGTLALTSCSDDDDDYDIKGYTSEVVFFDPYSSNIQQSEIYNTPAGVFGLAGGAFNVKAQYATQGTITLGAELDNSLVAAFNTEHGSESVTYNAIPASVAGSLNVSPAVIQPGTSVGDTTLIVNVPNEAAAQLTEEYYVLPLRLVVQDYVKGESPYDVAVRDTFNTVYAVIHNAGSDFIVEDYSTATNAIIKTPVGIMGGVNAEFKVNVRANNDATFTIHAEADNSLIADYNSEHGTNYQQLPADVQNALVISDGTIAPGQTTCSPGVTVTDPQNAAHNLDGEYLLPLKMTFTYPNGTSVSLSNAYLIILTKSSLINDDATELLGSAYDLTTAGTEWTLVSSDNFDASTFSNLFSSSSWSRYFAFDHQAATAECVIDFGKMQNVTGFNVDCDLMNDATISLSTDGTSWTECGNTSEHEAVSIRQGWSYSYWYVFYGAVQARYVKIHLNLDENNYYWRYMRYSWGKSYCALGGFNITTN